VATLNVKDAPITIQTPSGTSGSGGNRRWLFGITHPLAVVVTVTVAVAAAEPLGVTEVGKTEHAGACETTVATEQLRFTV
jgi:hypothetical protein